MTTPLDKDGLLTIKPDVVDVCVLHRAPVQGRERANAGDGFVWRVLVMQRAPGKRCPGSWELVHGGIERGELPEAAARREVMEEAGLATQRLYCITVNAFYLMGTIHAATVFAAVVAEGNQVPPVVLGPEHIEYRWLSIAKASRVVTWPREQEALSHIAHILRSGDAGVAEDVLRVRDD